MIKLPEYYLKSGDRTQIGENVLKLASIIDGENSEEIIKKIMYIMNAKVLMKRDSKSPQKFKRSAEQILQDKLRNGCCDSSTLFVTLCRAKGIPAVQIITANMTALKNGDFSTGHFFSGCYIKEKEYWVWLNSDREVTDMSQVTLHRFNPNAEFLDKEDYIFACELDYSDFKIDGIRLNSTENANKIHRKIYEKYLEKGRD